MTKKNTPYKDEDIEKLRTKIKRLEMENYLLKKEKKLFNKVQKIARIGSWMIDLNTSEISTSDEVYRIFDIDNKNKKLSLTDILNFIEYENKTDALQLYKTSREANKNFDFITEIVTKKNKKKNIRIIGEFEYSDFGSPVIIAGLVIDISSIIISKDFENKFKVLFENAPDGIYIIDETGKITLCNEAYSKAVKMKQNEIMGMYAYDFIKDKEVFNIHFNKLKQAGFAENEIIEIAKDKSASYIWQKSIALYNSKNEFTGAISFLRNINNQKNAEFAIKSSEEKYKLLVEEAVDGIFIGDSTGRFILTNTSAGKMTGYSSDELLKMKMSDLFHISTLTDKPLRYDLIENGQSITSERKLITNCGNVIDVQMKSKKLPNGMLQSIMRDITEQKKIMHALEDSEERYKSLYNNSTIGIFRSSLEGKILMANPMLVNLLGYKKPEELSHINIYKFIYVNPDHRTEFINKLKENEEVIGFETAIFNKDKQIVYVRINARLIHTNEADESFLEGTLENITKQVIIQNALREREEHFRILFEKSPLGIFTALPNGTILNANSALLDILGSPSIEATKAINILEFKPLIDNGFKDDFLKCIEMGETIKKEYHYTSKWGKSNYLWEHLFPFKENNVVKLVFIIVENVTPRKITEIELIKAKEKAEESDRLKTSFLANMSHEIRTPMNAIIGFTEILGTEHQNKVNQKKYLSIIHQNTTQLLHIINDILDISKIEVNQLKIKKTTIYLNNLIDKLYTTFEQEIATNQSLKLISNKTLSNAESFVFTDEIRLWQILTNLLRNSIKFTNSGYIEFGYTVTENVNNQQLQFYVKDTGIGINKRNEEIIFNPFRQSEDVNHKYYGGTGLGLSICKGLVELLGGNIWYESEINIGSTFYFTIPFVKKNALNLDEEQVMEEKSNADYNWSNKTILVVEDNEPNFIFMREILKKSMVKVLQAVTGTEAVEICRSQQIDLVLMDIRLPEMDGYEATRLIKKIKPDLPIIAQTAYAMADDRIKCFEAGCNGYFSKPVNRKALLAMIHNQFTANQ